MSTVAPFKGFALQGVWTWEAGERERFTALLKALKDGPWEIPPPKRQQTQRSLKQNAAYWAIVVPAIADYCGYEKDEAHEALKFRFLRKGEPDALLPTTRSTTELTVQEFEDYVRQVRQFAAETLGLDIPEPSEVSL